jgi:hypothetical protein
VPVGRDFLGRDFLGRDFLGRDFLGRDFLGRDFLGRDFCSFLPQEKCGVGLNLLFYPQYSVYYGQVTISELSRSIAINNR